MKEWPDWFPPKEMITRQPYLPRFMAGGETNPLGARAMYLAILNTASTTPISHQLSAASCPPAAFV
jgi:lipoprotein-anchoring transpeptidase ErfK/SrfK